MKHVQNYKQIKYKWLALHCRDVCLLNVCLEIRKMQHEVLNNKMSISKWRYVMMKGSAFAQYENK